MDCLFILGNLKMAESFMLPFFVAGGTVLGVTTGFGMRAFSVSLRQTGKFSAISTVAGLTVFGVGAYNIKKHGLVVLQGAALTSFGIAVMPGRIIGNMTFGAIKFVIKNIK